MSATKTVTGLAAAAILLSTTTGIKGEPQADAYGLTQ